MSKSVLNIFNVILDFKEIKLKLFPNLKKNSVFSLFTIFTLAFSKCIYSKLLINFKNYVFKIIDQLEKKTFQRSSKYKAHI